MRQSISQTLIESAAQLRGALLLPVQVLASDPCDLPGIVNAAIPEDPSRPWEGASGAVARNRDDAVAGAIGEGLERYAAAMAQFELRTRQELSEAGAVGDLLDEAHFALFSDAQKAQAGFPWSLRAGDEDLFAQVWRLSDNRPFWVPQELVGLGPRQNARTSEPTVARMPSTSSGLAAHQDSASGPWLALLRAAQEVLERDALTVTWLNGLGGREIDLPNALLKSVRERGGAAHAFDMTQAWNPHPVIAVTGTLPREGVPRVGLGIACRASLEEAMSKAILEWDQALTFAGFMQRYRLDSLPREAALLRRFEEHAAFYTLRPELWPTTPLMAHRAPYSPAPREAAPETTQAQLQALVQSLAQAGVDLYYRELTTSDVAAAGVRVMRVLSPQLCGLHADERTPFLGGRCEDVAWRYPQAARRGAFPNPLPHPLG